MRISSIALACTATLICATLAAQTGQRRSDFTLNVDLVQTDLIARDARDRFVADLQPGEFEVYEDGVKQDVAWLTLTHGGRVRDLLQPTTLPREGVVLPPSRARRDASGRIS